MSLHGFATLDSRGVQDRSGGPPKQPLREPAALTSDPNVGLPVGQIRTEHNGRRGSS